MQIPITSNLNIYYPPTSLEGNKIKPNRQRNFKGHHKEEKTKHRHIGSLVAMPSRLLDKITCNLVPVARLTKE